MSNIYGQGIASDGPVILCDGLPITPDMIVELLNRFVDRINQLETENDVLNESISEYDKAVNTLQNQVEQLGVDCENFRKSARIAIKDRDIQLKRVRRLRVDYKNQHNHYTKIMNERDDQIEQLEDEIAEWKLKYIDVCEKKDLLEEENQKLREALQKIVDEPLGNLEDKEIAQKALEDKDV